MTLELFWFFVLGFLLIGYAVLDGFDLGAGILYPFADETEKTQIRRSILPLWDGNEVWLVTFGGALFAGFPEAYATALSAFYLPFIFMMMGLVLRGVALEFRDKMDSLWWHRLWDAAFSGASLMVTFLFGVAVGDTLDGLPIGPDFEFQGNLGHLFGFYPLMVGGLAVAAFALHAVLFLRLKTKGAFHDKLGAWGWRSFGIFLVGYLFVTLVTLIQKPFVVRNFEVHPASWLLIAAAVFSLGNIPRCLFEKKSAQAFASSAVMLATLVGLFGVALYPNLLVSTLNPEWNLTLYNAASSEKTLGLLRLMVLLGLPFVAGYTFTTYWVFRGRN